MAQYPTRQYPTRQSLRRTAAAAGVLALVLATAPVVPTLGADGDLTLSSGAAYAKGKGGGHGGPGRGRGRGHNGQADFGEDHDDGHGATFGHSDYRPGEGLGHEKANGYGHHHDTAWEGGHQDHDGGHDGGHEWGHDGDFSDHHSSDPSFSAATDNARRDFDRAKSSAIKAWSDFWN
jgi:hypothetical protein